MAEQVGSSGLSLVDRIRRRRLKRKKEKEMLNYLLMDYVLTAHRLQMALHEKEFVLRKALLALKKSTKHIKNLVRNEKKKEKKKKIVQIAANVGEKEADKGYEGSSKKCEGYQEAEDEGKEEAKREAGVADDNGASRDCSKGSSKKCEGYQEAEDEGKGEEKKEAGVADDYGALRVCSDGMKKDEGGAKIKYIGDASARYLSYVEDEVKMLRSFISENDTDYIPAGGKTVDYGKWARYNIIIRVSQAFDVDHDVYPGHCPKAHVIPAVNVEKDFYFIQASITALQFFNVTNVENYEFYKIVRVNYEIIGGYTGYYITFEAKNSKAAYAVETFQALLFKLEQSKELEVKFCRIKE